MMMFFILHCCQFPEVWEYFRNTLAPLEDEDDDDDDAKSDYTPEEVKVN
jgi:hypothetical protein